MKKSTIQWVVAAVGLAAVAPAFADPVPVGEVKVFDSYGAVGGGEFLATTSGFIPGFTPMSLGEVAGRFETFCLEKYEEISFDVEYLADANDRTVASSTNIQYNGSLPNSHGGLQDGISHETAYLYEKFITKSLGNYDYGNAGAREGDATALQEAIWVLEQEIDGTNNSQALAWLAEAADAVRNGYRNGGQVLVLNLYKLSVRSEYQDILVYVPLPSGALAGLGTMGLIGLATMRRRPASVA